MMLYGNMDYNYSDYDSSSLYSDESVNNEQHFYFSFIHPNIIILLLGIYMVFALPWMKQMGKKDQLEIIMYRASHVDVENVFMDGFNKPILG